MDSYQLESCVNPALAVATEEETPFVSLESEIPEVLFTAMKGFIGANPNWDQYQLMSSALARFLYQNGCSERAVTERYLDDLFATPIAASSKQGKGSTTT